MKFARRYSTADRPVREQVRWRVAPVSVPHAAVTEVEVPEGWSDNAAGILASKYLRKAGVPHETENGPIPLKFQNTPGWIWPQKPRYGATIGHETSAHQAFHRLAGCWTYWGWREGYFDTEEDAQVFYDECYMMLALQVAAPNSPQWFNTGLYWAYGVVE